MINLVSGRERRKQQERVAGASIVLAASLRLSASELEDLAKRDAVKPNTLAEIIQRLRDDAKLIELAGGAA